MFLFDDLLVDCKLFLFLVCELLQFLLSCVSFSLLKYREGFLIAKVLSFEEIVELKEATEEVEDAHIYFLFVDFNL